MVKRIGCIYGANENKCCSRCNWLVTVLILTSAFWFWSALSQSDYDLTYVESAKFIFSRAAPLYLEA